MAMMQIPPLGGLSSIGQPASADTESKAASVSSSLVDAPLSSTVEGGQLDLESARLFVEAGLARVRRKSKQLSRRKSDAKRIATGEHAESKAKHASAVKVSKIPATLAKLAKQWRKESSLTARSRHSLNSALRPYCKDLRLDWQSYCTKYLTRKGKELIETGGLTIEEVMQYSTGSVASPRLPDVMGRVDNIDLRFGVGGRIKPTNGMRIRPERLWCDNAEQAKLSAKWLEVAKREVIPELIGNQYLARNHSGIRYDEARRALKLAIACKRNALKMGELSDYANWVETIDKVRKLLDSMTFIDNGHRETDSIGQTDLTRYARGIGQVTDPNRAAGKPKSYRGARRSESFTSKPMEKISAIDAFKNWLAVVLRDDRKERTERARAGWKRTYSDYRKTLRQTSLVPPIVPDNDATGEYAVIPDYPCKEDVLDASLLMEKDGISYTPARPWNYPFRRA